MTWMRVSRTLIVVYALAVLALGALTVLSPPDPLNAIPSFLVGLPLSILVLLATLPFDGGSEWVEVVFTALMVLAGLAQAGGLWLLTQRRQRRLGLTGANAAGANAAG